MASLDSSAKLVSSLNFGDPRLQDWSDHDSEPGGTHSEPELLTADNDSRATLDTRLTRSTQLLSLVGSGRKGEKKMRRQLSEDGLQVGGFTSVETPLVGVDTFGDDVTAKALEQCKKKVLKPYHIFLKTIGFRHFKPIVYDIVVPWYYRLLNGVWPILLCIFLVASCSTQILLCFGRDKVWPGPANDSQAHNISCKKHLLTSYLIPDVLLMVAYVYSLFVFRMVLPEHLTTLMETVFLGIISRTGKYSHKQLTRTLQFIGLIGLLWTTFSLSVSILRVFAERLADPTSTIDWMPSMSLAVRIVLLVISIIGFIGFDMAYTAVILNYSIECQLMIYYLRNICQRILAKEWEIDQAIREINNARQFLSTMNKHLSRAVSIMLLLFLTMSFMSLSGLRGIETHQPKSLALVAVTGILASFQWSFMLFLPIVQAARVSRAGRWLVKTSLEIRSRPYSYKDTPQLELDSFITYATSVDFRARLVGVPITPMLVILGAFILSFVLFLVFQYDQFVWAKWL